MSSTVLLDLRELRPGDAAVLDRVLAAIANGAGTSWPIESAAMHRACRATLDEQVEKVAEAIARNGIGFVLIDSAEKAIGASGMAESYGDRAGRLYEAVDRLGASTAAT